MTSRFILLALCACLLTPVASPAADRKPIILHIHADDHRADGLRALGNPVVQTPNLDTLVEGGSRN